MLSSCKSSSKSRKGKEVSNGELANEILQQIPNKLRVFDVKKTIRIKESKEPFTTSTLQQEAFAKLKFKTAKTQLIAQKLYEGKNIEKDIHETLILRKLGCFY